MDTDILVYIYNILVVNGCLVRDLIVLVYKDMFSILVKCVIYLFGGVLNSKRNRIVLERRIIVTIFFYH